MAVGDGGRVNEKFTGAGVPEPERLDVLSL